MELEEFGDALIDEFNRLANKYIIEIGVFSDDSERISIAKVGVTNAELMYIHENGSDLQNIPARPVLDMTIRYANEKLLDKALDKAIGKFFESKFDDNAFEDELNRICIRMENFARDLIYSNDGRLAPNSPSTIKRKGDNHPLFDTGQLARSISCRLAKRV